MVWEPGHWHWDGREYVWVGGHYIRPVRANARYVHARWRWNGGAWVWVPGHWE